MSISEISIFSKHMLLSLPRVNINSALPKRKNQYRERHSPYLIRSEKLLSLLPKSDDSLPLV